MNKVIANIKTKFIKPDGTLNGKIVSGAIGLVILFVQQLALCFGFRLHGDMNAIVGLINIILTILGFIGVMSDPTPVELPTATFDEKAKTDETPAPVKQTEEK